MKSLDQCRCGKPQLAISKTSGEDELTDDGRREDDEQKTDEDGWRAEDERRVEDNNWRKNGGDKTGMYSVVKLFSTGSNILRKIYLQISLAQLSKQLIFFNNVMTSVHNCSREATDQHLTIRPTDHGLP